MLDCNYSKVDVDAIVAELNIDNSSKNQLRSTLRKFEKGLLGGGLGKLKHCKLVHIKLKEGFIPQRVNTTIFVNRMNTPQRKKLNVWLI